jgi:hypothetical protein
MGTNIVLVLVTAVQVHLSWEAWGPCNPGLSGTLLTHNFVQRTVIICAQFHGRMPADDFSKALIAHLCINRGLSYREVQDLVSVKEGDFPILIGPDPYSGVSKSAIGDYVR